MSRKDAHAFAASLAATLMVSIVVFQAGDGTFGAVPADEIDGDEVVIVSEYDPPRQIVVLTERKADGLTLQSGDFLNNRYQQPEF
jgi:hypothetical protein